MVISNCIFSNVSESALYALATELIFFLFHFHYISFYSNNPSLQRANYHGTRLIVSMNINYQHIEIDLVSSLNPSKAKEMLCNAQRKNKNKRKSNANRKKTQILTWNEKKQKKDVIQLEIKK